MKLTERKTKVGSGMVRLDRVRKGKIQRKKLKSVKKGYKVSGQKLVRMKPAEKRKRVIAAKKATRKRAAKLSAILRKRKISIRKGKRQGIYS